MDREVTEKEKKGIVSFCQILIAALWSTLNIRFASQSCSLRSSQSPPEIELHANDLDFNNISFSFTLLEFFLQLFKLNCNCLPLNAVVTKVECCCTFVLLIQIENELNENIYKENLGKKKAKNLHFSNIFFRLFLSSE